MALKNNPYRPITGARCSCKRGQQRDNCAACEGTGWVVDFKKIRAEFYQKFTPSPDKES